MLTANKSEAGGAVAASVRPITDGKEVDKEYRSTGGSMERGDTRVFKGQFYRCGGPHMMRFCRKRSDVICYNCGKPGHIAAYCKQEKQGNSQRVTGAPAVTPDEE